MPDDGWRGGAAQGFAIRFDPAQIRPTGSYAVRARIIADATVRFETPYPQPVAPLSGEPADARAGAARRRPEHPRFRRCNHSLTLFQAPCSDLENSQFHLFSFALIGNCRAKTNGRIFQLFARVRGQPAVADHREFHSRGIAWPVDASSPRALLPGTRRAEEQQGPDREPVGGHLPLVTRWPPAQRQSRPGQAQRLFQRSKKCSPT